MPELLRLSSPTMSLQMLLAAILGISAHHVFYIRGEWHLRAPEIVEFHIASTVLTFGVKVWACNDGGHNSLLATTKLLSCYLGGLFCSITFYRLFLHRLRHFPGPRLAAVTKLWHVFQCRDSRNHLMLESMRKKYGTFVRTGMLRLAQPFLTFNTI